MVLELVEGRSSEGFFFGVDKGTAFKSTPSEFRVLIPERIDSFNSSTQQNQQLVCCNGGDDGDDYTVGAK